MLGSKGNIRIVGHRNFDHKRRTLVFMTGHEYIATFSLEYGVREIQAQTRSTMLQLGTEKGRKNMLEVILGYAHTGIDEMNINPVSISRQIRFDTQGASFRHRLYGIENKIEKNLF